MRQVLNQIRIDLDIPDTDTYSDLDYTGASSGSSQFKTTESYGTGKYKFGNQTMASTMDSQNTYGGMNSTTGNLYSTINSEADPNGLTDTQALQSYQLDLTRKEDLDYDIPPHDASGEFEVTMKTQSEASESKIDNTDIQSLRSAQSMASSSRSRGNLQSQKPRQMLVKSSAVNSDAMQSGTEEVSEGEVVDAGVHPPYAPVSRPADTASVISSHKGSEKSASAHSIHRGDSGSEKAGSVHSFHRGSNKIGGSGSETAGSVHNFEKGSDKEGSVHRVLVHRNPEPSGPVHSKQGGSHKDGLVHELTDGGVSEDNDTLRAPSEGSQDGYGEDEFEESDGEDALATATHRTSDEDF